MTSEKCLEIYGTSFNNIVMKILLVMVASVDGKANKGNSSNVTEWTSKEDQSHFGALLKASKLILVGRKTFEQYKSTLSNLDDALCVVLTKGSDSQKDILPGQSLWFTGDSLDRVIQRLEKLDHQKALLIGGPTVNEAFLKAGLVNEVWLTIEPRLLGSGLNVAGNEPLNIEMQLMSVTKLNRNGTLLVKYKVFV